MHDELLQAAASLRAGSKRARRLHTPSCELNRGKVQRSRATWHMHAIKLLGC
jgi:hypothetical protein